MKAKKTTKIRTVFAGLCLMALSFAVSLSSAKAQETGAGDKPDWSTGGVEQISAKANPASTAKAKNYYVEFRSRSALSYGHTFLVHGKLNAQGLPGKISKGQVAGLHPISDSSVPWMIGHIIPVMAERGWSDGDNEDEYVTAAYRVTLTEQEYARISAFIRKHQKDSPMWHAVLYNCNAWVGDVAKFMGLKAPDNTMAYPEEYITALAKANGGKITLPPKAKPVAARPAAKPAAAKPTNANPPAAKPANAAQTTAAPKPQTVATPAAATEGQTVR